MMQSNPTSATLRRFVAAQENEVDPVIYAFISLFCLLASYFVLVPLREEAGISLGTATLPKLFIATLVGVLLLTPATSAFLSRPGVSRVVSLRQFYAFLATTLLCFYILYYISTAQATVHARHVAAAAYPLQPSLQQLNSTGINATLLGPAPASGGGSGSGSSSTIPLAAPSKSFSVKEGDQSLDGFQRVVRAAFYVWLNVQNLVSMSSMWARCADVFDAEQAARLFGFISAGATVGQLSGSLITVLVAKTVGHKGGNIYGVILISALLMYVAAWSSSKVHRPPGSSLSRAPKRESFPGSDKHPIRKQLMRVLEGFTLIMTSDYLLTLCGYLMMTYVVGSLMYFQRSLVVATVVKNANSRTAFFATVYSSSAFVIMLLQMFATGRLLRVIGLTPALATFPLVCLAGVLIVGMRPSTTTVAVIEVGRKILAYSLVRPAREVLFTVLSREEKYRAKLTIDAVIQRLGDTVAALVFEILDVQLHLGLLGVAAAGAVACLVWAACAVQLGARYQALVLQAAGTSRAERYSSSGNTL